MIMNPKFENPCSQVNANRSDGAALKVVGKSPPKYILNMIASEIIVICVI